MTNHPWFEDPRTVLKRYGLKAKKSWGQNFLVSTKAVEKIALACVDTPGRHVIEIGAGLGTLTAALIHFGANVTAVERDPDMCNVLTSEFGPRQEFTLKDADAATFDYRTCLKADKGVVAGNLPYQITGRILRRVLESYDVIHKAVFMVQEEVADRICATPKDKARGALSVVLEARCVTSTLLRLPPTAFSPPPKVRSAVVQLVPRPQPLYKDLDGSLFDKIVKSSFSTRRKTIRNAFIKSGLCDAPTADSLLTGASIEPSIRAEKLPVDAFVDLTKTAASLGISASTKDIEKPFALP